MLGWSYHRCRSATAAIERAASTRWASAAHARQEVKDKIPQLDCSASRRFPVLGAMAQQPRGIAMTFSGARFRARLPPTGSAWT